MTVIEMDRLCETGFSKEDVENATLKVQLGCHVKYLRQSIGQKSCMNGLLLWES